MLGEKSRYDIMSSAHNTLARFDSRHHPKQSGLPLTVGADQGDLLPAVNAECCVFQQGDTRIGFRNVFSFGNYFTGSLRERKAEIMAGASSPTLSTRSTRSSALIRDWTIFALLAFALNRSISFCSSRICCC